jgi:type IV secretory pathway VirB6-like protein
VHTDELLRRIIIAAIVIAFIAPGSSFYRDWVQSAAIGLPGYFASQLGAPSDTTGPAAVFDGVWIAFWTKVLNVWHASPWEKIILTALLLWFVITDIAIALGSIFFTFLGANFLLYVLIAVGPVFILALLFESTAGFFRFWLDLVVALLAYLLILDVMLGFFITVLNQLIDSVASATTPWTDMLPGLVGAVIVFNVMMGVNAILALQVGRIHGATSAGMARAGGFVMSTARTIDSSARRVGSRRVE